MESWRSTSEATEKKKKKNEADAEASFAASSKENWASLAPRLRTDGSPGL